MTIGDLITQNQTIWNDYLYHNFVKKLANSTLNKEAYKHYLIQDYIFLLHYSRAYSLGICKSQDLEEMKFFLSTLEVLINLEIDHHIKKCESFGISKEMMDETDEEIGTISYTRYVLDIANTYGIAEILCAISPCAVGYAMLAKEIGKSIELVKLDKDYEDWIAMYQSEEFMSVCKRYEDFMNKKLENISLDSKKGKNLVKIFKTATMAEVAFWQQSYGKFHD